MRDHAFLNYDDDLYVPDSPEVQQGLAWALHTPVAGLWHPSTLLSHMLDPQQVGQIRQRLATYAAGHAVVHPDEVRPRP